jgi:NADH pyrophosphatase NudC (nudix superfamily)
MLVCRSGCEEVHWDHPVPVVTGSLDMEGHIVLVRSRAWPERWRGQAAGFLEPGGTAEAD